MAVHAAITSTFYLCLFWILFFSLHLSKSFFVSFFHRLWTWSFGITGCSKKVHPLCWPAAGKVINKPLKICWSQWAQPTWSTIGNQNDCFLFYSIQLFISNNHSPCIHTTDRCKFSMTGFLDFFEQKLEFCSTLCRLISAFVESFLPFFTSTLFFGRFLLYWTTSDTLLVYNRAIWTWNWETKLTWDKMSSSVFGDFFWTKGQGLTFYLKTQGKTKWTKPLSGCWMCFMWHHT